MTALRDAEGAGEQRIRRRRVPVEEEFRVGGQVGAGFESRAVVTGEFLFFAELAADDPDQRLEPEQRAGDFGQSAEGEVVALDVRDFVGEDGVAVFFRELVEPVRDENYRDSGFPT